jgi:hypothetical protein
MRKAPPHKSLGPAISFGVNFATYVVVFSLGGYYLDRRFGSAPTLFLLGFGFGTLGGIYELWKLIRTPVKRPPDHDPKQPPPPPDRDRPPAG